MPRSDTPLDTAIRSLLDLGATRVVFALEPGDNVGAMTETSYGYCAPAHVCCPTADECVVELARKLVRRKAEREPGSFLAHAIAAIDAKPELYASLAAGAKDVEDIDALAKELGLPPVAKCQHCGHVAACHEIPEDSGHDCCWRAGSGQDDCCDEYVSREAFEGSEPDATAE